MNLQTATPAEIDTVLAEIWSRYYPIAAAAWDAERAARRTHNDRTRERRTAEAEELRAKASEILTEAEPYEAEYERRGGWTRAYRVIANGGHVHRNRWCSSYPTTQHGWHPEVSGWDEAQIIDLAGEEACTKCYPNAPVNVLKRPSRFGVAVAEREERERAAAERRAQRERKDAERAAKSITTREGAPLKDAHGWEIKSVVTAQSNYVECAVDAELWGKHYPEDEIPNMDQAEWKARCAANAAECLTHAERILDALAAKRETSVEDQRAALASKVAAKVRKAVREMEKAR